MSEIDLRGFHYAVDHALQQAKRVHALASPRPPVLKLEAGCEYMAKELPCSKPDNWKRHHKFYADAEVLDVRYVTTVMGRTQLGTVYCRNCGQKVTLLLRWDVPEPIKEPAEPWSGVRGEKPLLTAVPSRGRKVLR
jgi:hypothetical protein